MLLHRFSLLSVVAVPQLPILILYACTGWPIKSKPLPNRQKIVLKPVNEIRFIRQFEVRIKHKNIIRWH